VKSANVQHQIIITEGEIQQKKYLFLLNQGPDCSGIKNAYKLLEYYPNGRKEKHDTFCK
jgi:capsid portal protein